MEPCCQCCADVKELADEWYCHDCKETVDFWKDQVRRLKQALKDLAGCDDEQVALIAQTDGSTEGAER